MTVILDLRPVENNLVISDMQKVTSAYAKDNNPVRFVENSNVLYADKKRTNSWLSLNRLQLPLGENQDGSVRRIAYADGKVKVQSAKNMSEMQKKLFEAGIIDEFGNKLFSDRDTESLSNRSLLANAFEGLARNDVEKAKMAEHQSHPDIHMAG